MCLFKIKVDEEEDDYVAVRERRVRRRHNADRIALASSRRVVAVRQPRDSYESIERRYSVIPPPQPVPEIPGQKPLVIRPASPPSPDVQYVHVSPRSSSSSSDRGEYVYQRREVRYERSPERLHEYRYVDAPEPEYPRERRRSRQRSRSGDRRRDDRRDRRDEYDETKIRIHRREYD
jgi:hypothetical protein